MERNKKLSRRRKEKRGFVFHGASDIDGNVMMIKLEGVADASCLDLTIMFHFSTSLYRNFLFSITAKLPSSRQQKQKPEDLQPKSFYYLRFCHAAAVNAQRYILHGCKWKKLQNKLYFWGKERQGNYTA